MEAISVLKSKEAGRFQGPSAFFGVDPDAGVR